MAPAYKTLPERLRYEFDRRGLSSEFIADASGVEKSIVEGYLSGAQDMRFVSFTPMCRAAGINPIRIITKAWHPMQLNYRNVSSEARSIAADFENVFLLMLPALGKPRKPDIKRPNVLDVEANLLIAEVNNKVLQLKKHYKTVECLYDAYGLPAYGLEGAGGFDAFLLRDHAGEKALAVFNMNLPTARIEVSLLHEFCHFLFDKDTVIPVDGDMEATPKSYYMDTIDRSIVYEFIAVKFAQLWLVPYDLAQDVYHKPAIEAARLAADLCVSPDVMANALFDISRSQRKRNKKNFASLRDEITAADILWSGRKPVRDWLKNRSTKLVEQVIRYGQENVSKAILQDVIKIMNNSPA